jgi:hypothetical protein
VLHGIDVDSGDRDAGKPPAKTVVIDYSTQPSIESQGKLDVGVCDELQPTDLVDGRAPQVLPGQTYSVAVSHPELAGSARDE